MDHKTAPAPKSKPVDLRIERSREALRSALFEQLKTHAYDEITIRDITGAAGVGYATFFRHYTDKRDLLNDLAEGEISGLMEKAMPILFADDTRAAALALCEYVREHWELWQGLLTGGASAVMREELLAQVREAATDDVAPTLWLPTELKLVFGVGGSLEILTWWLGSVEPASNEAVAEILDRLVVKPLMKG